MNRAFDNRPVQISPRQVDILRLIERGFDTEDIAEELDLSKWTIRDELRELASRLHCRLPDMPARARERGVEL